MVDHNILLRKLDVVRDKFDKHRRIPKRRPSRSGVVPEAPRNDGSDDPIKRKAGAALLKIYNYGPDQFFISDWKSVQLYSDFYHFWYTQRE